MVASSARDLASKDTVVKDVKKSTVALGQVRMRIHGRWYDLTNYNHPGGPVALGLGNGRDATALFESHHPFTDRAKLATLLEKHAMSDADAAEMTSISPLEEKQDAFAWNDDVSESPGSEFWQDVREQVRAVFQAEARERGVTFRDSYKATWGRWAEMFGTLAVLLALLPFYFGGYWFTLVALPVMWWVVAVNWLHDGSHFSVSTRWWINALASHASPSISPLMWYHQHVIGHHAYPNMQFRDPDVAHAPSLMRPHESIRWKSLHRFQLISLFMIWTLGSALYMSVIPLKMVLLGSLNHAVKVAPLSRTRIARHVVGRVLAVICFFVWPFFVFPLSKALVWAIVPIFIHSVCFMLNTQVNHFTPETAHSTDRDFWRHQVVTAHNFATGSYLHYLFSGGLNYQIEHHLFPTVNHVHLHKIQPIVKDACIRYNVNYAESVGYFDAMEKYVTHMNAMSKKQQLR